MGTKWQGIDALANGNLPIWRPNHEKWVAVFPPGAAALGAGCAWVLAWGVPSCDQHTLLIAAQGGIGWEEICKNCGV